jgi:dienelactone hydrolase
MAGQVWKTGGPRAARSAVVSVTLAALLATSPATARPLQLEDLLQRENFGVVSLAPGGRWLLVEQRGPVAGASRFDFGQFNNMFRTRIMIADAKAEGSLRPLFTPQAGVGYAAGSISPDGARVAIYRLSADRFELGIATFATGEIQWLGVTPEAPWVTRMLQWVSPTQLVAVALAQGETPFNLRAMRPQLATPQRWAATARGGTSVTAVGSGRLIDVRPHAPPKRLLRISAITGKTETLATGDFIDLELSTSGRRLAVVEAAEDIALHAGQEVQGAYGVAVRRMRLRLLDLDTREVTSPMPQADVLTSLLSWSPQADDLLLYVRADGAPWTQGHLMRVAAANGKITAIGGALQPAIVGRPERVWAGWLGGDPLLFGHPVAGGRNDWFRLAADEPVNLTRALGRPSAEGLVVSSGGLIAAADGAAWRIGKDGEASRIGDQPFAPPPYRIEGFPDRTSYALHAAAGLPGLLGAEANSEAVVLGATGPEGRGVTVAPGEVLDAVDLQGAVVDQITGGGRETLIWRRAAAPDTVLARINDHLASVDHPRAIAVAHVGPNGEHLKSWLFLPQRTPGSAPPPLVVVPYPGTSHAQAPDIWRAGIMDPTSIILGHGYAVLVPSLPTWRAGGGPADGLANQVLAIIDAAAQQIELAGRFDPDRLALWGHSHGGYATVTIVGQTNRFRVGVAAAPGTDFASREGEFDLSRRVYPDEGLSVPWTVGWVESLQGDMRKPPWEDPARYFKNSAVMQAAQIQTPLMIAYGEIDGTHPAQAEQLFSALYRQNKDALLLTYWGEPHLLGSPGNLRDYYTRGLAFLDRYLAAAGSKPEGALRPPRPGSAPASDAPTTPPPPP